MKTVTPAQLAVAYCELYPSENPPAQHEDAMRNWLARYESGDGRTIARANWYGKVTRALFRAIDLKQPRTVAEMVDALEDTLARPCSPALACPSTPDHTPCTIDGTPVAPWPSTPDKGAL